MASLAGSDAAGRFHRSLLSGLGLPILDRLQHDVDHGQRGGRRDLSGGCLDEVRACKQREPGGAAYIVVRRPARRSPRSPSAAPAARLFDSNDLIEDAPIAARPGTRRRSITMSISSAPPSTAILVSASLTSRLERPDGKAVATDATLTPEPFSSVDRSRHHVGVDADRCGARCLGIVRIGQHRLAGQIAHLSGRISAFQGREIDHRDRQVDGRQLRGPLDRPSGQPGSPLLDPDGVDAGKPEQEAPQRGRRSLLRRPSELANRPSRQPTDRAPVVELSS